MKFYLTPTGQLIEHNPAFDQYRQRNRTGPGLGLLDPAEVAVPAWQELKREKFSQLMNEYFRNVEDSWTYRGEHFRKLPNYESLSRPRQPQHPPENLFLVYHWGQLYYFQYSYGGFGVGQLYDRKTRAFARWAKPRHCAPVYNESRKQLL